MAIHGVAEGNLWENIGKTNENRENLDIFRTTLWQDSGKHSFWRVAEKVGFLSLANRKAADIRTNDA